MAKLATTWYISAAVCETYICLLSVINLFSVIFQLNFWTRKAGPKSHSLVVLLLVVTSSLRVQKSLKFLDPEGGSQKATVVVLVVVLGISSLKIPKAFLIHSGTQRNFACTFLLTLPTDLPSQIFHLFSN